MTGLHWRSLLTFDARPQAEIDDDIRAELDAHVAMIEDELVAQGVGPADARIQALNRFGDPRRLARDGRRIKLGDRIMLQRVNLVLLVLIAFAVAWLFVENQRATARNITTLEQVAASIAAIQQRPSPDPAIAPQPPTRLLYIHGLVQRPGPYAWPPGGITLKRALIAAGGLRPEARTVFLDRDRSTQKSLVFSVSNMDVWDDPALDASDVITVSAEEDPRAPWVMKINLRGYVPSPARHWVDGERTTLAEFLRGKVFEPGATGVTLERSGAEPSTRSLSLAGAVGAEGGSIVLREGDVVTITGVETDAEAPQDWTASTPSDQVRLLAESDRQLAAYLRHRDTLDTEHARLRKSGHPIGHTRIAQLREQAAVLDAQIAASTRHLLQPAIDEHLESDPVLQRLVADQQAANTELQAMIRKGPLTPPRDLMATRKRVSALDTQIIARVTELSRTPAK